MLAPIGEVDSVKVLECMVSMLSLLRPGIGEASLWWEVVGVAWVGCESAEYFGSVEVVIRG